MPTIEKRGPYQYRAKVRVKGQKPVSKTFSTKKNAKEWAKMVESEMERNLYICRTDAEKMTLSQAIDRYIENYIPNLSHSSREVNRAKKIQNYQISKLIIAAVRISDVSEFIKKRQAENVSANTIRLDLALISRIFEVAASDWGMESLQNPVKRASKPKLPNGRDRRLAEGEEEKLLSVASERLKPVIKFALETAMRREEIASLSWDRIDFDRKTAHLPSTKNGQARSVPLSPKAIEILQKLCSTKEAPISEKVFNMTANQISSTFKHYKKKVKLDDLRFHDLRHEAISRFFEKTDLDSLEIQAITGHKSMQMLSRYTHLKTYHLADRLAGVKRGIS